MPKKVKRVLLGPETDLLRILEEVHNDKVPRLLERDGEALAVVLSPEDYRGATVAQKGKGRGTQGEERREDIWAGYDPERVREALAKTAGSWADLDADALIADLYRAREQGSRPPERP